jgi:hypothetical protein
MTATQRRRQTKGVGRCFAPALTRPRGVRAAAAQAVRVVAERADAAAAEAAAAASRAGAGRRARTTASVAAQQPLPPPLRAAAAAAPSVVMWPLAGALLAARLPRGHTRTHASARILSAVRLSHFPSPAEHAPALASPQGAALRRRAARSAALPAGLRGSAAGALSSRLLALETSHARLGGALSDVANDLSRTRAKLRLGRRDDAQQRRAADAALARHEAALTQLQGTHTRTRTRAFARSFSLLLQGFVHAVFCVLSHPPVAAAVFCAHAVCRRACGAGHGGGRAERGRAQTVPRPRGRYVSMMHALFVHACAFVCAQSLRSRCAVSRLA